MTSMTEPIVLTTKDHAILEQMLEGRLGTEDPFGRAIAGKLSAARTVRREAVAADVVTINSRVAYRVDDGPLETRVLVHEAGRGMVGLTLPLSHARGIAMLGLRAGASTPVAMPDGRIETLTVVEVRYQPEAASHVRLAGQASASVAVGGFRLKVIRPDNDGGPGPSAA